MRNHLSTTLIALFFILSTTICAQKQVADSLINVLNTQKLTSIEQLDLYNDICKITYRYDDEQFVTYTEKGLALAKKENNKEKIAKFTENLGVSNFAKGNYEMAIEQYEMALFLAQEAKSETIEASIYLNMGTVYMEQAKYETALEYYQKSLHFFEIKGDKYDCLIIYINTAILHFSLDNNDRGIYYLEKAKTLAEELNNQYVLCQVYLYYSKIYLDTGENEKAVEQSLKALEISRSAGLTEYELDALNGIARIYSVGLNEYDKAEKYANEALQLAEKQNKASRLIVSRLNLSHIYLQQKRYKESDASASMVWQMDSVNYNIGMVAVSDIILANIFLGNKDKAAAFFDKYTDFVRQYNDESLHQSLAEMEVKYETEKKELRITALEKEKMLYSSLSIIGCALLLSLLLLFVFRHRWESAKRKLAEQQIIVDEQHIKQLEQGKKFIEAQTALKIETAERTRLARDLHDGLGGMLSVLKLHLNDVEQLQDARDMLDHSIDELRRVAHHLMPAALLHHRLKTALEDFCLAIPNTQFDYFGDESPLDESIEILI
jgi:tetratricopeptide (TPR) repeat protein